MSSEDIKKRLRYIKVSDDFAAKSFLGEAEKPKDREDFYAQCPLDSVIRAPEGGIAYGYVNEETAALVKGKPAPVLVTGELYHHLISKQEKRELGDVRLAVQEAMAHPTAMTDGNDGNSFNVYFAQKTQDGKTKPMYVNLAYCEKPVPCYTVRSMVPAFKMKGAVLAQGENMPSFKDIPAETAALEAKITNTHGDRVTGMTWNKSGNVLKMLRLFAEENELPTAKEAEELKAMLSQGDVEWLTKNLGLYVKQAFEQTHSDKFFQMAKESGVLATVAPEVDAAVTPAFLETMQRADDKSHKIKQAIVLATLAKPAEDKSAVVDAMAVKYGIQEGRDEAKSFALYGNRLMKAGKGDLELLWSTVEAMTNNFKKPEFLSAVKEMCEAQSPDICATPEFKEKMAFCAAVSEKAPELKMKIAETMKSMPKEVTREERLQAQENAKKAFMQSLAEQVHAADDKGQPAPTMPVISKGGRND